MSDGLVYFKPNSGGGGSSSGEYVKDAFEDISLPASSNTGFSSTATSNPLSQFFADDDLPRYGVKTLWIKDLTLLDSREWLNNKPTYKIIWNEPYSAAYGYVSGNVRVRNSAQGKVITLTNIDDIFGVSGVIRRTMFICGVTSETGTADIVIDGVDTTVDADFGSAASDSTAVGYRKYNPVISAASNQSQNIHDYRLTVNQTDVFSISGVIVYHENATSNIDCFPGSTYVNKDKKTTSALATLGFTTIASQNGANTIVYKTSTNTYDLSIVQAPTLESIGIGSSGTNQIQVTTGHGASFRVGDGIVVGSGGTYYVGSVNIISTDTLTVGPTLAFGVSNMMYRSWYTSATAIIGSTLYGLKEDLYIPNLNVLGSGAGFGLSATGNFYWQNQTQDVRVWGRNIQLNEQYGFEGIAFSSTVGFLQTDGYFQAAEIQVSGAGIMHGTFSINGIPAFGVNEGFTGVKKYTVFTEGQVGWNSFVFSQGASLGGVSVNRISLYGLQNPGITFGRLAQFDDLGDQINRGTLGATINTLGGYRRVYADSLFLKGPWARGETFIAAGNVQYIGITTNCSINFQWYGKDIALIGTAASAATLAIDGVGVANTFNSMISVASEGFHSLTYTVGTSATCVIQAIDYNRSRSEFISLQNSLPNGEPINEIKVYEQPTTPTLVTPGTIWGQDSSGSIWVYLFDRYYKLSVDGISDNPNVGTVFIAGGDIP